MTQPKPTYVETPSGDYTFYNEDAADMTTPAGRFAWFCAHFEIEPPALSYDPDEPGDVLLTDELVAFCDREGMSLDWLAAGRIRGALAAFREKYKKGSQHRKFADAIGKLDETECNLLTAGLKLIAENDADVDDVMASVKAQIEEHRLAE